MTNESNHPPLLSVIRHSSFVTRHSSLVIRHSSFVIRHSSLVIRHSSFVIRHSSLVTRHSSLVIRHSSFVTRHSIRAQSVCGFLFKTRYSYTSRPYVRGTMPRLRK